MKQCIVISDSFKGTLSSQEICAIARREAADALPGWNLLTLPVADGGEGTIDCFQTACGGSRVPLTVQGPFGDPMEVSYLRLDGDRAVVEMASCAGLPLVGSRKDPCRATTYGVGEQILHAVQHGCRNIILGLGGSATNDGGCGCAAALGVQFLDAAGQSFVPVGGTLDRIHSVDPAPARALLQNVTLTAMCDIDNPMHGPRGAAFIFGPQKGADPDTVEFLDGQLRALDRTIRRCLGQNVSTLPGGGAAGAFGAGAVAFLGAALQSGIETVLDAVNFDRLLADCQWVITGEGQLDRQSLDGKVVSGVARRAKTHGVPVTVLAGSVDPAVEESPALTDLGVTSVFSINRQAMDFSRSASHSPENYARAIRNLFRLAAALP